MKQPKAILKQAWPYQTDRMNLPVEDLEMALPFYTTTLGFRLVSRSDTPHKSAVIARDDIQLGLAENGGDPTQDGCFFAVNDVANAFSELKANGLQKELSGFDRQKHGQTEWKVFFVVAPDGLCYCYGEPQL
jgi:lactoylglutathione lyase